MDIPKLRNWRNQPQIDNLNDVIDIIQGIVDEGIEGPPGEDGTDGTDGTNGWAPVLGIESDSGARYLFIADWTGGTGTKPATGDYIGVSGLVSSIDDAINIRGAAGADGTDGEDGTNGTDGEGVPTGGDSGQILAKASGTDFDTEWIDESGGVSDFTELDDTPADYGTDGQVLTSTGSGMAWEDASGGGGGISITFGTWTPGLSLGTGSIVFSVGEYWDLGDIVWIRGHVIWDGDDGSNIMFTGLPFTPDDTNPGDPCFAFSPDLNEDLPAGIEGVFMNQFNANTYALDNTGGVVQTGTGREGLHFNGWYRKDGS